MKENKTQDNTVVAVSKKKLTRLLNLRKIFVKDDPSIKHVVNAALDYMSETYEEQKRKEK